MKGCCLLVLLTVCQCGNSDDSAKLPVTLYYESECSDSVKFIEEQLVPAVEIFQNYIKLRFIPFGKAHSVNHGHLGFHCQHGPSECQGNRAQECTLHYMQDRTDLEKVLYVNCEMKTAAGTTGDMTCVQNANVPVHLVQECISSDEGRQLQLISEEATKQLDPQFIPTITINNVFDQEIQDKCLEDMVGTLCSMIEHSCCDEHHQ